MTFINSKRERIKEIMEKVKTTNPKLYKKIEKANDENRREFLKEARNAERERAKKSKKS